MEATSPSSATSVVDASAAVRALAYGDTAALRWLGTRVSWPSLVYVEVGHAVLRLHRAGRVALEQARAVLDALDAVPADVPSLQSLARPAWFVARDRGLTVYDACYVVLAEALDAPLVTADQRLAAATAKAVLVGR